MFIELFIVLNIFLITYVYFFYGKLLKLIVRSQRNATDLSRISPGDSDAPSVTVLLTVYNEIDSVEKRISNIFSCDYPENKLTVVVASDGSDDGTDDLVLSIGDSRVRLLRTTGRLGKTETQNRALETINSDIVVFTDAGTVFSYNFITAIVSHFHDETVGAVDGRLIFKSDPESSLSESQGYYWNYELSIRELESRLGVLAVVSGACFAARRVLIRPMESSTGEDCIVPLDVVSQGYRVVHEPSAIAYDFMDSNGDGEMKTRVRMTLRNWQGTWSRAALLNPLHSPGYSFALWSHKILRWLSPFFIISVFIASLYSSLMGSEGALYLVYLYLFSALVTVIGWVCETCGYSCRIASILYSFTVVNIGFLLGVLKAFRGATVTSYR